MSKYRGSISMPTKGCRIWTAATPVLPLPMYGSRMQPPGGTLACSMHQSMSAVGFWVG